MRAMAKIQVSTASFDVKNNSFLKDLENRGFDVALNPYGRKLTKDEVAELLKKMLSV